MDELNKHQLAFAMARETGWAGQWTPEECLAWLENGPQMALPILSRAEIPAAYFEMRQSGMKPREIAARYGVTVDAVYRSLHRERRKRGIGSPDVAAAHLNGTASA